MAVRKTGSRRIVVDGVVYLWRVPRRPTRAAWDGNTGLTVTVQQAGCAGSVLALCSPRRHPTVARVFGSPVVSVRPSQVATAIRQALELGWEPTRRGLDFGLTLPP